jgi:hypothetical protein
VRCKLAQDAAATCEPSAATACPVRKILHADRDCPSLNIARDRGGDVWIIGHPVLGIGISIAEMRLFAGWQVFAFGD